MDRASNKPAYTIYSKDPILEELGLSMFDIDTLIEFAKKQGKEKEINFDYLTTNSDGSPDSSFQVLYSDILGALNLSPNDVDDEDFKYKIPHIEAWDDNLKSYILTDITDFEIVDKALESDEIKSGTYIEAIVYINNKYLQAKNNVDENFDPFEKESFDEEEAVEFVRAVKKSFYGCVKWTPLIYYSYDGYPCELAPELCLFLQEPQTNSNERIIASKEPIISAVPTTVGGKRYSASETDLAETSSRIGVIGPDPVGDYDNPDNKRAGKLDVHFNPNTGKFESGTKQMIVRLLTDLPPVIFPDIDIETFQDLQNEDFFGLNGEFNQLGNWTKETHIGSGLCLHVQRANPELYGPNFTGKCLEIGDNEKEVVQIVNRTPSFFSANEIALASYMDGEWVPQKIAEGVEGTKLSFGVKSWSFTKGISNSDTYFRDRRFYENSIDSSVECPDYAKSIIDPDSYEQKMRNRFYKDLYEHPDSLTFTKDVALANFYPADTENFVDSSDSKYSDFLGNAALWDIQPSERYWQITAFDQTGDFLGGKNEKNIIARTSLSSAPAAVQDQDGDPDSENWLEFWGPSFPGGYSSTEVQELMSKRKEIEMRAAPINTEELYFLDGSDKYLAQESTPAFVDVGNQLERNWSKAYPSPGGMFGNAGDVQAQNLPAEIATNAVPNGDGAGGPLENLGYLNTFYGNEPINLVDATLGVMAGNDETDRQSRFTWLYEFDDELDNSGIYNSTYDLTPNSLSSVDFLPLNAETIFSTDYIGEGADKTFAIIEDVGVSFNRYLKNRGYPETMLGGKWIFERNKINKYISSIDSETVVDVIPYDKYVRNPSTGGSKETYEAKSTDKQLWDEEFADCVGVISSKSTINFRGDELRFLCNQQFGLRPGFDGSLSGSSSQSIIGSTLIGIDNGAIGRDESRPPRWGGATDRPFDFHTTALHVKVFDAWPSDQTIYDPRYFGVLHFNPGQLFTLPEQEEELVEGPDGPYNPDKISYVVDFRVPTYSNNTFVAVGPLPEGAEFAPEEHWRVNSIRRGMLLSKGGFRYFRLVCGIEGESMEFVSGGTGFVVGDIVSVRGGKNVLIEVLAVGPNGELLEDGFDLLSAGEGFTPDSFKDKAAEIYGGTGEDAEIYFTNGFAYHIAEKDEGPVNQMEGGAGYKRLTNPSGRGYGTGDGPVTGTIETSHKLREANKAGQYDLFFHFHNDITHTSVAGEDDFFSADLKQSVSLEINAV